MNENFFKCVFLTGFLMGRRVRQVLRKLRDLENINTYAKACELKDLKIPMTQKIQWLIYLISCGTVRVSGTLSQCVGGSVRRVVGEF